MAGATDEAGHVETLAEAMREKGVRFVRLDWVDNGGVLRGQAVSAHRIQEAASEGVGIVTGVQAIPVHGEGLARGVGIGAVGQVWLVPAPETIRVLPWEPSHASVMGAFVTQDGSPWAYCPRAALARAVGQLADHGLSMQAAFEHEFVLLRREGQALQHFEASSYASVHGLDHAAPILDDLAEALESQGVPVETVLKEAGLSQYEISTVHGTPTEAADRFVTVRESIGAVAARHGLVGTCLPLVFAPEAGNGWHIHFSLWRDAQNLTGEGNALGATARAFVAGVLAHLPALLALTTPSTNSFRRLRPGAWCGAYRAWGYDHKEVPLRVPTRRVGAPTNVELKSSDATANPYLSLTGLITAGLDGVSRGLTLPEPIDRDPQELSEDERRQAGIEPLPGSLAEALELFERDEALQGILGPELTQAYVAVKRQEIAVLADLELADEVGRLVEVY